METIPIIGYEKRYLIFKNGNVYSILNKKLLKPHIGKRGYLYVILCNGIKSKHFYIHRLIAIHFIENSNNYKIVNHKDSNKINNSIANLEWCCAKSNARFKRKTTKKTTSKYKGVWWFKERSTWAVQVNGRFVGYFKKEKEAAIAYNNKAKELFGSFALLNEVN